MFRTIISIIATILKLIETYFPILEPIVIMYFYYRHYIMKNKINICMENGMNELECVIQSIDINSYVLL
jgi:hypothetical protein